MDELFYDGKPVGYEPNWTIQNAIENLMWNTKKYPNIKVEGWYAGEKLVASGIGYELFFDGTRVGYEPTWTRQEAIENLIWNTQQHSNNDVVGWYNGEKTP